MHNSLNVGIGVNSIEKLMSRAALYVLLINSTQSKLFVGWMCGYERENV